MKKIITCLLLLLVSGCSTPAADPPARMSSLRIYEPFMPMTRIAPPAQVAPVPSPPVPAAPPPYVEEPQYEPASTETFNAPTSKSKKPTGVPPAPEKNIFDPTVILAQLRYSTFGYSIPGEANVDDEIDVTMIINPSLTVQEIEAVLPRGERTTGSIQISRIVQAKLDSRDFDIVAITPERQVIAQGINTAWRWSLKARTPGPNKVVKITVTAVVLVDGERTESYIDTYTSTIKVSITPQQRISRWLSDNWQWAWGALLIPLLGYFYNKKRKK